MGPGLRRDDIEVVAQPMPDSLGLPDTPPSTTYLQRRLAPGENKMRFAGNIIWFVLGGWYIALLWLIGAALFALSIVGIPLTIAALQMASLSAWPFGRAVVHVRELDDKGLTATTAVTGTIGFIVNVIWA